MTAVSIPAAVTGRTAFPMVTPQAPVPKREATRTAAPTVTTPTNCRSVAKFLEKATVTALPKAGSPTEVHTGTSIVSSSVATVCSAPAEVPMTSMWAAPTMVTSREFIGA